MLSPCSWFWTVCRNVSATRLHPSCCNKKPLWLQVGQYLYFTQKFCWANKVISCLKQGRANLISCGTAKSHVSPPLFMPETLCHNRDLWKWKVFVQRIYTSSWHVPPSSGIAHFCHFLHLLYSPEIHVSRDKYKFLLSQNKSHMHFSIAIFLFWRLYSANNSPTVGLLPVQNVIRSD